MLRWTSRKRRTPGRIIGGLLLLAALQAACTAQPTAIANRTETFPQAAGITPASEATSPTVTVLPPTPATPTAVPTATRVPSPTHTPVPTATSTPGPRIAARAGALQIFATADQRSQFGLAQAQGAIIVVEGQAGSYYRITLTDEAGKLQSGFVLKSQLVNVQDDLIPRLTDDVLPGLPAMDLTEAGPIILDNLKQGSWNSKLIRRIPASMLYELVLRMSGSGINASIFLEGAGHTIYFGLENNGAGVFVELGAGGRQVMVVRPRRIGPDQQFSIRFLAAGAQLAVLSADGAVVDTIDLRPYLGSDAELFDTGEQIALKVNAGPDSKIVIDKIQLLATPHSAEFAQGRPLSDQTNLRNGPGQDGYAVVGQITRDDTLIVLGEYGGWLKVFSQKQRLDGWVRGDLVEKTDVGIDVPKVAQGDVPPPVFQAPATRGAAAPAPRPAPVPQEDPYWGGLIEMSGGFNIVTRDDGILGRAFAWDGRAVLDCDFAVTYDPATRWVDFGYRGKFLLGHIQSVTDRGGSLDVTYQTVRGNETVGLPKVLSAGIGILTDNQGRGVQCLWPQRRVIQPGMLKPGDFFGVSIDVVNDQIVGIRGDAIVLSR